VTNQLPLQFSNAQVSADIIHGHGLLRPTRLHREYVSATTKLVEMKRPIHYLGSKLRMVDHITEVIDLIDHSFGPVCDLFAGSGTVSLALSQKRSVTAIDIQEYSKIICSAILNPIKLASYEIESFLNQTINGDFNSRLRQAIQPIEEYEQWCRELAIDGDLEPLCNFLEYGSMVEFINGGVRADFALLRSALTQTYNRLQQDNLLYGASSLATQYFGGIYFSYRQAAQIDVLLGAIRKLQGSFHDVTMAALLSTVSEIVNTVGKQFAQPLRPRLSDGTPKTNLVNLVERDRSTNVFSVFDCWLRKYASIHKTEFAHQVIRDDYIAALNTLKHDVKVVYADPPYTRDHYSRYYHVLETLALGDSPELSTVAFGGIRKLSRGYYRKDRHQSPFCIKSKAPSAFESLFKSVRALDVPLLISYSPYKIDSSARPRVVTIDIIESLARKSFRSFSIISGAGLIHSKLGSSKITLNGEAELLLLCEP
jgi:adenine-specific DNA methylase